MKIHQIRNATLVITYNNIRFLIDPWFMPKESMPGFDSAVHPEVRQPRCELPISVEEIIQVDAVILTHWHSDHIDEVALGALRKDIPFFVQNGTDDQIITQHGFTDVRILAETGTDFLGIRLFKTATQHGERAIIKPICESIGTPYDAMGIVFSSSGEKTLYVAGDTIWCPEVQTVLNSFHPEVIVINACGASVASGDRLIMNLTDVQALSSCVPDACIIASHMDTVSHLTVTRADIRALNLSNVLVPDDNEIIER